MAQTSFVIKELRSACDKVQRETIDKSGLILRALNIFEIYNNNNNKNNNNNILIYNNNLR